MQKTPVNYARERLVSPVVLDGVQSLTFKTPEGCEAHLVVMNPGEHLEVLSPVDMYLRVLDGAVRSRVVSMCVDLVVGAGQCVFVSKENRVDFEVHGDAQSAFQITLLMERTGKEWYETDREMLPPLTLVQPSELPYICLIPEHSLIGAVRLAVAAAMSLLTDEQRQVLAGHASESGDSMHGRTGLSLVYSRTKDVVCEIPEEELLTVARDTMQAIMSLMTMEQRQELGVTLFV